ncbi:hypothetical protein HHI36_000306 [Cryptolaemus montrouzieri]|uniref:Neprilysin n=1 Tax=Cryptolaemus montrouzieri TaxID=559131 RepID=A0ABD2P584_9CUCU
MLEPGRNRASNEKEYGRKRTGLEKKLIVGVSVASILALVFLILYFTKRSCSISEEECTDKYCVRAAAELLDYADLKQDPCQNFYQYVCGHYIKEAVKKDSPTPILQISTEFKNEMKASIVDPIKKKDSKANVALKKFYQACMNEEEIDKDKDKNFFDTLNELGGWPLINGSDWEASDFDWLNWHIKSVKLGVPVVGFFSFRVAKTENRTMLRVAGSTLEYNNITKSNFESVMKDIAKAFNAADGYGSENIEVYDFLKRVRKLTKEIVEEDDEDEDISTVQDLYKQCPQFDWLKLINGVSGQEDSFNNDTEIVFGLMKDYCNGISSLLKDTPTRIIANYYVWSIIQNSHEFMSEPVRDAYDNIKTSSEERYKTCFDLTDERFKYVKETIYIRHKMKPKVREQLTELIDIMKDIFKEHIRASTWMDDETKQRGVEKTDLIEKLIGADEILYDVEKFDRILGVDSLEFSSDNAFQVLKEKNIKENQHLWETLNDEHENWRSFFMKANQVNAFFAMPLNLMIIPAPILNSVFFNYKNPAYMNYGAIGRVVGHELMHGFGEAGREVLLKNDVIVDWWTNATAEAFNKTKQCVIQEYEKTPFRYELNGTLTLEENLADFVGIDIAYEAYLKWEKKHGAEKKLPGIPLTPKQIFWIQTGTFLCFRKLDDEDVDMEAEDEHAIPGFRVSAGTRNSKYFAKDFNCPVGSFMNPKEKCRIL